MFQSLKNRGQSSEELTDELLSAYLDGQLPRKDRATFEARLRQEQALVTRLEGLRQTKTALANLPRVEVPRNFILAPSMVAPPKPAVPPRRRRTWPVFGWATAIATLLLLVVFAGDLFFYTPSERPQPSDVIAAQPKLLGEATSEIGVERPSAATDAAVVGEGEAAAEAKTEQVVIEAEVLVEATTQAATVGQEPVATELAEQKVVLESEPVAEEMVESEPAPPATGGGGEAPTEEALATWDVETPSFQGTPAPGVVVTTTVEGREAIVTAPAPPEGVIAEEAPLAAAAAAEEAGTESDVDTQTLREGAWETPPDAVARVPEELIPVVTDAEQGADDTTPWLRLAEIGLGLAILALATVTLILRRREA
jgi:anti-sigma factor RsiW